MAAPLLVGMADIVVARGSGNLTCLGLGSCIGLSVYDASTKVGGMAHIMLPETYAGRPAERPGKFADTAVPELIRMVERAGAHKNRLIAAYCGGAQVFNFGGANGNPRMDIGARNSAAVKSFLQSLGMRVVATDVGGSLGRTVMFDVDSGEIRVRTVSQGERFLCRLGD